MARVFAGAAFVVGALFAAISVYWGLGGTWLLDTVGSAVSGGHPALVIAATWGAAVAKIVAAVLPWLATVSPPTSRRRRPVRALAWIEAVVLILYGGVLTIVGLLVQSGVVAAGAGADHRALRWHAFLWDPWFLVWGLLVTVALVAGRRVVRPRPAGP